MLSPLSMTAPIHITASDFHSTVEVVDHDSNLNLEGLSPRYFGSSAGRNTFSPSRLSMSSLSCSRSPLRDATNMDYKPTRGYSRSWSRGSDVPHSGTSTAVPTRHSSPAPAPAPIYPTSLPSLKPIVTRPRGRSGSQRKVNLSLSINRPTRYPSRSSYIAGHTRIKLRKVGVEECRRWVTGTPPPTWPVVRATDGSTTAHATITHELPKMLERAIKDTEHTLECLLAEQSMLFLHNQHHLSVLALDDSEDVVQLDNKTKDLQLCVKRMKVLLAELRSNETLRPIEDDDERDVKPWNRRLERIIRMDGTCTFMDGPALFVEAYVYRRLRQCFSLSTSWRDYDVLANRKQRDFVRSADAVLELSKQFSEPFYTGDCVFPWEQLEKIREAFAELLHARVSGSSKEYKGLLNMTEDELRACGLASPPAASPTFSTNHEDRMWKYLSKSYAAGGSRVDFVLNEAGFEMYCDLALADFMIQTGLASTVHFHGKRFPSSGATQNDWDWLIKSLKDKRLFPYPTSAERDSLHQLGERWEAYIQEGKFLYEQHLFWSMGLSCWDLPTRAPDLFSCLSSSSLVIVKGDSNYRKLVAGCHVPADTPFYMAIGPMATHPKAPPICSVSTDMLEGLNE